MPYGQIVADSITTSDGYTVGGSGAHHLKNRIINGAMTIDQRNNGASVTVNADAAFFASDRFQAAGQGSDGVYTIQRSATAPAGFANSIVATVTTADSSIGSSQQYNVQQHIEGLNTADLAWGTSSAKTVTLSFWVRSSVTGTFSGAIRNAAADRSYPFAYTINAANTFEQKVVTIPGDQSGTWGVGAGIGLNVIWTLGAGTSRLGPANAWAGANYQGVTGQTNLIATNGATWYLTGVQLEAGSTATSYDYRHHSVEFAMCQRYYQEYGNRYQGSSYSSLTVAPMGWAQSGTDSKHPLTFVVPMRSAPTVGYSNIEIWDTIDGSAYAVTAISGTYTTLYQTLLSLSCSSALTTRRPYWAKVQGNGGVGYINLSAEL
jgi:hypothetical protein